MADEPNKVIYSMLGVGKVYGTRTVLKDISLSYFYGAKIGVIGLNGSGKSTLLRIMAGLEKEFIGKTILSPGYTIGFLEQEPRLDDDKTVRQIVEEGVRDIVDTVARYDAVSEKLSEPLSDDEMARLIALQGEPRTPGISMPGWKWPWTPCGARRETRRSGSSRGVKGGGWPFAGFS